jgi:hypothetical protein
MGLLMLHLHPGGGSGQGSSRKNDSVERNLLSNTLQLLDQQSEDGHIDLRDQSQDSNSKARKLPQTRQLKCHNCIMFPYLL